MKLQLIRTTAMRDTERETQSQQIRRLIVSTHWNSPVVGSSPGRRCPQDTETMRDTGEFCFSV